MGLSSVTTGPKNLSSVSCYVSARWVPKVLSDEHKRQRVEISQILVHRCQQEVDETVGVGPVGDHHARNKLLEHIITADKTWVTPEYSGDKTRLNDILERLTTARMQQFLMIFCVILGALVSSCLVSASSCNAIEKRPCTCSTPEGVLSLQTLMNNRPNQKPLSVVSGEFTYYIAPCNHPLTTVKKCHDLSNTLVGCQVNSQGDAYGLGAQGGSAVMGDPQKGTVTFLNHYTSPDNINRISKLLLKCSDKDGAFTFLNQTKNDASTITYMFMLETKYACLNAPSSSGGGLSTGSVLVIIFFVALIVYLVGGTLFLKYVRKAEGRESIPNYEFWSDFPSLVKDGVLFTLRGCKAESTYEKI
ncbi:cation-dependent mannose-6-phosphate receptor [Elysia marginata]|uniref:Cation-dependent mannose-6-phosphate receptor n=1 Tax=Elysia marginata TaxID=1093978 RepID=A0AAV4GX90_9GAST|nr:cation-dependent mannose-6-phosphate receptor [Elysia marginata]